MKDSNEYMEDEEENELLINRGSTYKLDSVKLGKNRVGRDAVLVIMTLVDAGVKK